MREITFGLDFGTSKTAVTWARTDINAPINDVAIDGPNRKRIPTCVLRKVDEHQVYVGHTAEEEFKLESDVARARLDFSANFKPHIHQGREAREAAQLFMTAIAQKEGLSSHLRRFADTAILAAGCPVSWTVDGGNTLKRILKEAGFPPAFVVPEPVGAALYFLTKGALVARDLYRDIVVFDWGAGTFDVTLLRAGQLKIQSNNSWGSNIFGGRLFDDLFYQWTLEVAERNGRQTDIARLERQETARKYLHGLLCREIKESFSSAYSAVHAINQTGRPWIYRHAVTIGGGDHKIDLGDFAVSHLNDFDGRMRAYRISDLARPWLEQAQAEIRPAERDFVVALLAGDAVDLAAWGSTLIAQGLSELRVERGAIAVLTGGSCNWAWFRNLVRKHPLFVDGEKDVHLDDEPEMTIARGLARAYTIGVYSRQKVDQLVIVRDKLTAALSDLHHNPLSELALRINAEMRADAALQDDVRRMYADYYRDFLTDAGTQKRGDIFQALLNWLEGLFKRVTVEDQKDLALRLKLERRIGDWLTANEPRLQRRWGEQFAHAAQRGIMDLLRKELNLEGLVEVAVEACGAIGPTSFDVALQKLGADPKFGISKISSEVARLKLIMDPKITPEAVAAEVQNKAAALTQAFFETMPDAISRSIARLQSPTQWANYVVDDLIRTLQTIADFANASEAARLDQASQPPPPPMPARPVG
jgi:hypothetical protein